MRCRHDSHALASRAHQFACLWLYEIHEEEGRTGKRTNIRTVYVGLREDKPAVDVRREAARAP